MLARTPRTGVVAKAYETSYEYTNPVLRDQAPLRMSPRGARSKSRERTIAEVLNASQALAEEVATDFVERGQFNERNIPQERNRSRLSEMNAEPEVKDKSAERKRSKSRDTYHSS